MGEKAGKKRIQLLDILRGFAIAAMLVTHIMYDIAYFFYNAAAGKFYMWVVNYGLIFPVIFVGVSGVCAALGKNTAKRGAQILLLGVLITVVTAVFTPDILILNDVLVLLGFCMLTYAALEKYLAKIPVVLGVAVNLFLFACTYNINKMYIGIKGLFTIDINPAFYQVDWLYPFGIYSANFRSANYYPFFPWLFLFLAASFIGIKIKRRGAHAFAYKNFCPPLAFLGRNSLVIYLVHQPVIFAVVGVINYFLTGEKLW